MDMCELDHRDAGSRLLEPLSGPDAAAEQPFVSRGGIKLENALIASGLNVGGRRALDVGASTGGFSDCLLRRGATGVIAVDVGYGQLAWSLRTDPRVTVLERTNARHLTAEVLPYRPQLATIDVSFISLRKILPAVIACMTEVHDVLALVKPQFEIGRGRVGKGGVVRDPSDRREVLLTVGEAALGMGASVLCYHPSGLPGPKGNRETFIHLAEPGRGGASGPEELEEMARSAEPA
jgi:23S rRNA (cytidine1920-2'-O)/16S rRNA (cytidine1409-2'-O)-methyltransferase